ncbi:MAG: septation protein IspZ [Burkholderiales bacterium]|nr:septation protein IspZ [Burkholderiales bacterium]
MQNNLFFELIPLIIFFIIYYITKNIFLATGTCIIVCWLQVLFCKLKYNKITRNLWISTILITLFGGLSVMLHNKTFIMLKPTALYWLIAGFMLISQLLGRNLIKSTLDKEIQLDDSVWNKLSIAWSLFFIAMGALNIFVVFNFSEYTWVKFKVFGTITLILAFGILSGLYVYLNTKKNK